jgi:hypothetical protein
MLRPARNGQVELSLIDLHSVRFAGRLSPLRRRRNLAALHQFFAGRSTRTDRLRFYRAYVGGARWDPGADTPGSPQVSDVRREATRLERLLRSAAEAGWRRADRAWNRGNRHVRRLTTAKARCRGLATFDATWLQRLAVAPEAPFARHLVRWCKRGKSCRVAQVSIQCGEDTLHGYWKALEERGWLENLTARFRQSASRRAWEMGHALLRRGIDTPKPLAVVERRNETPARHYLLTAAIEESTTLDQFLRCELPKLSPFVQAEWLEGHSERLARQLRRLHGSGFDHRDLKFSNLLVSREAADCRVWLLDLDHVRTWRRLPFRRAVQNLSRLAVSARLHPALRATDLVRFLRVYLGSRFGAEWRDWWRAIARRLSAKLARNERRRRPLG